MNSDKRVETFDSHMKKPPHFITPFAGSEHICHAEAHQTTEKATGAEKNRKIKNEKED